MDLQISVVLLFILFTPGHSLSCQQCGVTGSCVTASCPTGFSNCLSAAVLFGGTTLATVKTCILPAVCPNGSMNAGIATAASYCCSTDLCNTNAPDTSTNTPNGKKCYYCDGQNCSNTVNCSGTEDRCLKATGTFASQSVVVKGCVSKSLCDASSLIPNVQNVTCCEGNLCNGAQSVVQSLMILCVPLLSFILML